jgi:hypothetical protein
MAVTDVELKRGTETRPRVEPSMAEPGSRSKPPTRDSSGGDVPATHNDIGEQGMGQIRRRDVRSGDASQ